MVPTVCGGLRVREPTLTQAYGNCSAMWAETVLTAAQLSLVLADTQCVNKLRISAPSEAELELVDAGTS